MANVETIKQAIAQAVVKAGKAMTVTVNKENRIQATNACNDSKYGLTWEYIKYIYQRCT